MKLKDIESLIKMITDAELTEFKMRTETLDISIRTQHYQKSATSTIVSAPAPLPTAAPGTLNAPKSASSEAPKAEEEPADSGTALLEIKSPIVGTFYRSASPDKPPFVKVGDTVNTGDVVCIVEAMKLFNEIDSEISGKIVKVLVEDASPVEYDQVLFLVDPAG